MYNFEEYSPNFFKESVFNSELVTNLKGNFHITTDPQIACVYMVVFLENFIFLQNREKLQLYLQSLPYWGGMLLNYMHTFIYDNELFSNVSTFND